MNIPLRLLIIEDSEDDALLIVRELKRAGYEPTYERVDRAADVVAALDGGSWDVIVSDYNMPNFSGSDALRLLRDRDQDTPFIFVSGTIGEDVAVDALRAGAQDYVIKGNLRRLAPAIDRELRDAALRREHARAETALRLSQRLESVGRLAGGIAHDFNNLLTGIMGCAEFVLLDLPPGARAREDVEEILKAAHRAASLVQQLLAFSRRQVLEPTPIGLNGVVEDMEKMLRRLIGEDITLQSVLDPALGVIRADRGQVEQVIVNLVVNARDAMPRGGELTIVTANTELDAHYTNQHTAVQPGRYVMVAVSDTGIGMDQETQARIFEPFFTTKAPEHGSGLGLSTVYGIVKQSGGNIWVYSELGRGTTFKVYFPLVADGALMVNADAKPPLSLRGSETVLIAEDEETVRRLTQRTLQKAGYTVLGAPDGAEALRIAERHPGPIHLLVSDVVMPRLGGGELAARLAAARPGVRVLYLSGYTDPNMAQQGLLQGGAGFLQKPFTTGALTRKVREVLDAGSQGEL